MDKKKSNAFKKDVMDLYKRGFTSIEIAKKLNKKYNDNLEGLLFKRFRTRIRTCICRNKIGLSEQLDCQTQPKKK